LGVPVIKPLRKRLNKPVVVVVVVVVMVRVGKQTLSVTVTVTKSLPTPWQSTMGKVPVCVRVENVGDRRSWCLPSPWLVPNRNRFSEAWVIWAVPSVPLVPLVEIPRVREKVEDGAGDVGSR
jgi:hypothetical protein